MGWLHTQYATKQDVIRDLTRETDYRRTLRQSVRGNTLYQLVELKKDGGKFIEIDLLRGDRNFGWGYKDLSEDCGPCVDDCPLYMLDLADPPSTDTARSWRASVRAYHARINRERREAREKAKTLVSGTAVKVAPGITVGGRPIGGGIVSYWKGSSAIVRTPAGLVRLKARHVSKVG